MWGPFDATRVADLLALDGWEGITGYSCSIQWHQLSQVAVQMRQEEEKLRASVVEKIDLHLEICWGNKAPFQLRHVIYQETTSMKLFLLLITVHSTAWTPCSHPLLSA